MNIQRKNSAHHFRMQSEREQTLGKIVPADSNYLVAIMVPFDNLSSLCYSFRSGSSQHSQEVPRVKGRPLCCSYYHSVYLQVSHLLSED